MKKLHVKHTFCIEAGLSRALTERAAAKNISKTEIVEAALASLLSPDDEQRIEAVLARRLDRISRQLDRLDWQSELSNEALGLFVRFWLTSNPPLPEAGLKAAQAMGKKRWQSFVEALTRRISLGPKMRDELQQMQSEAEPGLAEFPEDQEEK